MSESSFGFRMVTTLSRLRIPGIILSASTSERKTLNAFIQTDDVVR